MKKLAAVAIAACSLYMSGCATILTGETQKINVTTSNKQSATATIQGKTYPIPGVVEVKRKNANLAVKASGNCQGEALSSKNVNPVFFVNILSGGVFGSTTDYATESMWKYDDNIDIKCK